MAIPVAGKVCEGLSEHRPLAGPSTNKIAHTHYPQFLVYMYTYAQIYIYAQKKLKKRRKNLR